MNNFSLEQIKSLIKSEECCKEKKKKVVGICCILLAIVAVAGISYKIYNKWLKPRYDEFEDEFEDSFEDEFFEDEDLFEDEGDTPEA